MSIQLELTKEKKAPISFSMNKTQKFIAELHWDSKHDLDVHAITLSNGHYTGFDDILSTYNPNLVLEENSSVNHVPGGKKPFRTVNGFLTHKGDMQTGLSMDAKLPDETLVIDLTKAPKYADQVSFFISVHPPGTAKFNEVKDAKLIIKDDSGNQLLVANLSHDFDQYDLVQMGSIALTPAGNWNFDPNSVGINGSFNDVLSTLG